MINFDQLKKAFSVFEKDLEIVGHPDDPKMSIFDKPREWGKYNLTLLPKGLKPAEFKKKLKKIKVIGVTCMDKRVANRFYQFISEGYKPEEVLLISIAGGLVQEGEKRRKGLKTILTYLSENTPFLEKVVLSDHDCRCGAVAFWLKTPSGEMPKGFGEPGGKKEKEIMKSLISEGYQSLAPKVWKQKGLISLWLVSPNEEKKSLSFEPFDPYLMEAKRVKDLK